MKGTLSTAIVASFALLLFAAGVFAGSPQTSPAPQQAGRRYINVEKRDLPFSDGVLVGDTLYLAGKLGLGPDGKPPADVKQEARLVMDAMRRTLEAAGMTMDDLVSVQVFCPELAHYDDFNAVYRTYFKGQFPARAFIGSGALLRGARFEVQGIAVRRK